MSHTYHHGMSDLADIAQAKAQVAITLDNLLDFMSNHDKTPENVHFVAEPSGSKYRIILVNWGSRSAYAFVDALTGDLYKAASWKVAAKGVRYNILKDQAKITARFTWAGGWLYSDQIKRDNAQEASK